MYTVAMMSRHLASYIVFSLPVRDVGKPVVADVQSYWLEVVWNSSSDGDGSAAT